MRDIISKKNKMQECNPSFIIINSERNNQAFQSVFFLPENLNRECLQDYDLEEFDPALGKQFVD